MGGKAFDSAKAPGERELNIQPMTAETYLQVKEIYLTRLQSFFGKDTHLEVLKEAPEKLSFGDVDYLVSSEDAPDFLALARSIGATALVKHGFTICSVAVRQDGFKQDSEPMVYTTVPNQHLASKSPAMKSDPPAAASDTELYAQIDIELVPPKIFQWRRFLASYGGVGMILGRMVRDVGFVVHGDGFYIYLSELQKAKRLGLQNVSDRDGQIFLTADPGKVLEFLHMSVKRYEDGFHTLPDLYAWLTSCRALTDQSARRYKAEIHENKAASKPKLYLSFFGQCTMVDKFGLAPDQSTAMEDIRASLLQDALAAFSIGKELEEKRKKLNRTVSQGLAEAWLKKQISEVTDKQGKQATEIVRAFRRWVAVRGEVPKMSILPTAHRDEDSELYMLVREDVVDPAAEAVARAFVKESWEVVRELLRRGKSA
ncbi:hypothetical protein LTR62_005199 [Meristemomyces frigidus]|uniref:Uncharacterized protein n=1 Tax=Meristemomyces frigidus TaxID=1508187 RepID=A0AAN7TDR5_9PEZI|nr:hypothetical protein LTR62_005199 [Meristemomyces frigidus]